MRNVNRPKAGADMKNKPRNQGKSLGQKHRQAVLTRWRVEIMRGSADQVALEQIRQRILHDPEVRNDPQLASLIEQSIQERSNDIALSKPPQKLPSHRVDPDTRRGSHFPKTTSDDIQHVADSLRIKALEQLARNDEMAAGFTLDRLKSLQREHSDVVDASMLRRLFDAHNALRQRRLALHREIEELANKAEAGAAAGNLDETAAAMRQLSARHVMHPTLFSDDSIDAVRERVFVAGASRQQQEAAQELMRREREVSDELRSLYSAIHEYHCADRAAPGDNTSRSSPETAYRNAILSIRHHDREWLAGTVLELVDLLDDWVGHPTSADKQVDAFICDMKSMLKRLHAEIRRGRTAPGSNAAQHTSAD